MPQAQSVDFFTHQDIARRNTKRLVLLFAVAVLGIIVAIYTAVRFAHYYYTPCARDAACAFHWWDPQIFLIVSIIVALFIGVLSGIRILSLKSGGGKVARMLGGRIVQRDTKDPKERMLVNVIEEMAIASGVPVPEIYVLDSEIGINAFAAGFTPNDAAVAVTRGCLNNLTRDELQGVIAHEFSHILNGDMRLNVRLIGVLFGILAISIVGRYVLSGTRRSKGKGAGLIVLAAIAILIIGYIGAFVGRLIQSAVCRQKEFLADSSAVQFTRNPSGLAGALKKIGGLTSGSIINDPQAEQASHLFFSQGIKLKFFTGLLATHPPLPLRIKRLDPSFDGNFEIIGESVPTEKLSPDLISAQGATLALSFVKDALVNPDNIMKRIGQMSVESIALSSTILRMIPAQINVAVSDKDRVEIVVYALLLDEDISERAKQIEKLRKHLKADQINDLQALHRDISKLDPRCLLPIFELAMPMLRTFTKDKLGLFSRNVNMLIEADERVSLYEFALQWMMENRLLSTPKRSRVVFKSIKPILSDVSVLLAVLAKAGSEGDQVLAAKACNAGRARIEEFAKSKCAVSIESNLTHFDIRRSLNRLSLASFGLKSKIVDACAYCAIYDNRISVREAELLRVVCMALECPLPPFVS